MLPKDELVTALDSALDEARFLLRVKTDEALAEKLSVSTKTISFWRNGRWTQADEALIQVLVTALKTPIMRDKIVTHTY
jgi:hypothetical protein